MTQEHASGVLIEHPLGAHDTRCLLVRNFLRADECAQLLRAAARRGFASAEANYPPSYRNNQRLVFDDPQLAQALLPRLRSVLPEAADGRALDAINPRWRSCRYEAGQSFNIHQDGVFHAPDGRVSRLTFMLYLDDCSTFSGGDTVFHSGPPDLLEPPRDIARVRPTAGALIVFDHALWHSGATVHSGHKTILRSDLLYCRLQPVADSPGHRGYVFCLAALDGGRVLSGGRDGTIRLNEQGHEPVVVGHHRQSVLGLHPCARTRVATVSRDRCLAVHDLAGTAAIVIPDAHDGAALCVSGQGERLFTGGADHQIAVWDLQGRSLARLHGHRGWVWDLAVLDAQRVLSVGEDARLLVWDAGLVTHALTLEQPLRAVLWCAATARIVVADAAGDLHLLVLADGRLQRLRRVHAHHAQVRRLRMTAAGAVLSCAEDGQIQRRDLNLGGAEVLAQRDGFATDALLPGDCLISSGYAGGVQWHGVAVAPTSVPSRTFQPAS